MLRVLTTLAPLSLASILLGCASGSDEVSVPVADVVVTAPVVTIELPQIDDSVEPVATTTEAVASSAAPTTTIDDVSTTAAPVTTARPATTAAPAASAAPATTAAPAATTAAPPATTGPTAATEAQGDDGYFRRGDEGPEVGLMQFKLSVLGYMATGSDSGFFDQATESGLRSFQADYGLGVDGVFGPLTGRALNAAVASINVDG